MEISIPIDNSLPDTVIHIIKNNDPKINSFILQFGLHAFQKLEEIQVKNCTENIITNIEHKHSQEIENIKLYYDNIIKKINYDLSEQSQKFINDSQQETELYKRKLQALQNNKDLEISSLQDNFNIKIKTFEDKYTHTITELQNNIKQLNQTIESKNNNITQLNKEIELKNSEKISEINSYYEQGRNLSKKDFEIFYSQSIEEKNKLFDKIKSYEQNIQLLNNHINDINIKHQQYILSNYNSTIMELKNDFSVLKEKLTGNASKGDAGENLVESFINQNFSLFSFENTSKLSAKGDFFLTNNTLKLLIENKNVQNIKSNDTEKFYRDVNVNAQNGSINAALFISLHDTYLVNGKKNFVFEIKYGVPIIFIGNVFENIQLVKFAICTLLYLVENGITNTNKSDNDDFTINLISLMNTIFNHYDKNIKLIQNNKKLIESLLDNIKLQTASFDDLYAHFNPFIIKYPQYFNKNESNNNNNIQTIVNKLLINKIPIRNIKSETIEKLGFSKDDIKSIGVDNIKKAYRVQLTEPTQLINQNIVQNNDTDYEDFNNETNNMINNINKLLSKNNNTEKPLFNSKNSIYPSSFR